MCFRKITQAQTWIKKEFLGDVVDIFTNNIDMSDTEASEDLLWAYI